MQSWFMTPFSLVVIKTKEEHSLSAVRDSSVGTATRDRLDGTGIESQWWGYLPQKFRQKLGPTQPTIHWVLG